MSIESEKLTETLQLQNLMRDPTAVLALISERDQLKAESEALRRAMHELANHPKLTASQADILRAAMDKGEQS